MKNEGRGIKGIVITYTLNIFHIYSREGGFLSIYYHFGFLSKDLHDVKNILCIVNGSITENEYTIKKIMMGRSPSLLERHARDDGGKINPRER